MSLSLPEKCLRGFDECRPYSQIASNIGEPEQQSFYCCGKNNGMLSTIPGDIYTLCFKGEFRDQISFNNRRDLVDNSFVIMGALAHIELDEIEEKNSVREDFSSAINYALNDADGEGLCFLELWCVGDWGSIAKEFPDFKLPAEAGASCKK